MPKAVPIGVENFGELITSSKRYLFVDKSLMIKELIDSGSKVSLIIRPRRWGKTLNMSMLQHFFAAEVNKQSTKGLFDSLKIAQEQGGDYLKYQGKYPVIFISFKDVKEASWDLFFSKVTTLISDTYREHRGILLESDQLSEDQKIIFKAILRAECNQARLESSLKFLSECLYTHYNQKVMILIDEYDTPLNAAYNKDYFEKVVSFFKGLFGSALKGNNMLEQGVMTGILRLSKNRMLSDLNNLKLYSLMEKQYSKYFGFSEEEVKGLFAESGVQANMKEVQHWYNGYRSGPFEEVYNPWSILNCIEDKGSLNPYWVQTADEGILKDIFKKVSKDIEDKTTSLLEGTSIESTVDEYVSFEEVRSGNEQVLWSLLWTTGYLKFIETPKRSATGTYVGLLAIPNYEVSCSYRAVFPKWIRSFNRRYYDLFIENFVSGNVEGFIQGLEHYLLKTPSYFDLSRESGYHNFLSGLTASLEETHEVHSNREIGLGRPDLLFIPRNSTNNLGIILEIKRDEVGKDLNYYQQLAQKGFEQINLKKYDTAFQSLPHIRRILKICLIFYGKEFVCKAVVDEA